MRVLNIREARAGLTDLEGLLNAEGEVAIARRGKTIARLVSPGGAREMPSHEALRQKMRKLRTGCEKLVRADRDSR